MKHPKTTKRFCPSCKKQTEHKVKLLSTGIKRSSLKRGSIQRAKERGAMPGLGNQGRWGSKPPITKWKRKTKNTKKHVLIYTCGECKRSHQSKQGKRMSKLIIE